MFEAVVYSARREALALALAQAGIREGVVILLGNRESPMNYADNCYPFRQDSSFLYFVGVNRPALAATIDLATGRSSLYGDDATMDDIVWTGPVEAVASLAALSGIAASRSRASLARDLEGKSLLFFPPYRADSRAELAELLGKPCREVDALASMPLVRAAIALREIKSPGEIAEMETAVAITVDMHKAALATARAGMLESDVYGRVAQVALASGGGLSFPVIATTKGAILHTHSHDRTLEEGGLFLLDAGAEAPSGYAGDLSTTFPIGPALRRAAEGDLRARPAHARGRPARCCGPAQCPSATPISRPRARESSASRSSASCAGDPDEAVESGRLRPLLPLRHGPHDRPRRPRHGGLRRAPRRLRGARSAARSSASKSLRLAKPLKAGMTFTVEPGIYFIPELFEMWKAEGRIRAIHRLRGGRSPGWAWAASATRRTGSPPTAAPGVLGPAFDKSPQAIEAARD